MEIGEIIKLFAKEDLKKLDLCNENLFSIPAEIGNLLNIEEILLRGNQLTNLPDEISKLANLSVLDLTDNRFITLPLVICRLINLRQLYLRYNKLTTLPAEIGRLTKLEKLQLGGNKLNNLPSEIGLLENLQELYISFNNLSDIPEDIGKLRNLEKLYLSNNQLNNLPLQNSQLRSLKELYIHNNQLKTIPPEIAQLSTLKELYLSDNQLTALPRDIGKLTELNELHLRNNLLSTVPVEIGQLVKLNTLDLSHNSLTSLPQEICGLVHLTDLDLSHNQLSELPAEIGRLKNLKILDLRDNPLPIPPEILGQPDKPHIIINFYLGLYEAPVEKQPLNEAKMLIVGQPEVGKTSLVHRLVEDSYDPQQAGTKGIDINKWQIGIDDATIQLNIWDFGGQEIMHATHQFFLTKRSLYILVLDSRQGEQENFVEYWLKLIQSFGGDSPVIVICNKADERELDLNWVWLQKKYPNIKSFAKRVSCKTGEGITDLRTIIINEVAKLKHIHDQLLSSWFSVKNKLVKMVEGHIDYISYKEYKDLCIQEKINNKIDQETLLGFLHDLGIVLHFRDQHLEDTNVLNPDWVTKGVYLILTSHKLFQQKGILNIDDIGSILDPNIYPRNKYMFIIDMMHKFELCFGFEEYDNKRFLVPDLLSKEEPYTGDWENSIAFQYHYDVLPSSVISRFIVRMHTYISKNTYWRQGVVLEFEGKKSKALVKADLEDKKIFIYVKGKAFSRRTFLEIIRADFNKIHKTIPKLQVNEKIPIPGHPDVVVDYQHLRNLEEMGHKTFVPEGLREEVNVRNLLSGLEPEEEPRKRDMSEYRHTMGVVMGDQIIIPGQGMVVTRGSQANNIQFQQIWNQIQSQINMVELIQDLEKLQSGLKEEAEKPDQFQAVTDVASAAQEAKAGNGPKMMEYLKKGGMLVLKKADEIGTKVAVEVIKKALGF